MQLNPDPLPITAGDDEIRRVLEDVEVPPLLVAVATLTGDLSLLREDLAPSNAESFDPTAGITPEQAATARDLAAAALAATATRAPSPRHRRIRPPSGGCWSSSRAARWRTTTSR